MKSRRIMLLLSTGHQSILFYFYVPSNKFMYPFSSGAKDRFPLQLSLQLWPPISNPLLNITGSTSNPRFISVHVFFHIFNSITSQHLIWLGILHLPPQGLFFIDYVRVILYNESLILPFLCLTPSTYSHWTFNKIWN